MKVDTDALRKAAEAATKTLGLTSIKLEIVTRDFHECANPRAILALMDEREHMLKALRNIAAGNRAPSIQYARDVLREIGWDV